MEQFEPNKSFFKEIVTFTEKGKIKSLDLMYAFVLGITMLFVYFFVGNALTIAFEGWFSGLSRAALNCLDIGVPAVLCAGLFIGLYYLLKRNPIILMAYYSALIMILAVIVIMLIRYSADARALLTPVVVYIFLIPIVFGTACLSLIAFLYRRRKGKRR